MLGMAIRYLGVIALLAWGTAALAQPAQTGTIAGSVVDQQGQIIPGVTVTATSTDRGFARTSVTDDNGRFVFPAVPVGRYSVAATLQGFETAEATNNLVETDR